LQAAVAGLAREVEAMRRAMRQVATAGEVARLAEVVAELGETTAAAAAGRPGRQADPVPSWLVLPTALTDAAAVLRDLSAWLGDVYLRYADAARGLPECWLWHPEIVEELVWLMYAWLAAYRDDEASVRAAGDWHDRLRPGVVRRITHYAGTCSLELHLPARAAGAPEVPVADATHAIADWWTRRRDEPGPEPTNDQMIAAAAASRRARQAPTTDQMLTYAATANTHTRTTQHSSQHSARANGRGGADANPGTQGGAQR
jgi:hypothetical protein